MNKVVTIHLDGIAYQLEEGAYAALQAYLDDAKAKLANNPDKEEIVTDLEQAIGAKLSSHLSSAKNVLTESDVSEVLTEMGPVAAEGATAEEPAEGATTDEAKSGWSWPHNKRLYRVSEGRWIAGVCTGLAAYFNVDVTLVRILFVLCTIFFHGLGGLIYIILMIFVPRATTPKDYENLSGMPPVTAQELVDRARKSVEDFTNSGEWHYWKNNWKQESEKWKAQHKAWKHQGKAWQRMQKNQWKAEQRRYRYEHRHSAVSEIFGIACATLAISFALWFLYGHVTLVHDFFDAMHHMYNSFINSLAQLVDSNNQ